ncbi:glycoside hydrolase family 43 protein [Pseudoduganella chitinolytica]|uniref:Glycoside hydrolase family 43 protein n=1 Tax=Pseudoduganella chitinolytica TaxID=34070 RepID=A0ABY8BDD1_9BURK|nr:glycoside hydrolase family 43 protein [Pseudoduganella chitinolytica]WEF33927.1 glycoside hydrolase family 43 protein [Pseudoduganella chitinolytica]
MFHKTLVAAALAAASLAAHVVAHAANPLFPNIYTADPAALVDNGRVYLYVGKDDAAADAKDYLMKEWRVYSTCDMKTWKEHGAPLSVQTFGWARADAWASDIAKRNGKYYFYATVDHATNPGKAIGVAVSDSPTGPFKDARGTALVTNDMTKESDIPWDDIDPTVFIDDDGQAYLYWGNRVLKWAKLKPNMIELDGPIHTQGIDNFTEAAYLHKHKGTYYLSYSREFPEETAYATGPSATGPWTYRGVIMKKNAVVKTIHHAIVDFNGKSYIFYHNDKLPGGGEWRRSAAVEELPYNADGTIAFVPQTAEGPAANPSPNCR